MSKIVEVYDDHVWIKWDDEQLQTEGGIHLPEYSAKLAQYGLVVAIGPGKWTKQGYFIETKVKVGDRVCFPCGAGYKTQSEGQEYLCMQERDLWARERRIDEPEGFGLLALWDKIILKRAEPETMIGLIHLPEQAIKKPCRGTALSVGPGLTNDEGLSTPIDVQVGEGVRFKQYQGMDIEFKGEEYVIISDLDVIVKEEEVVA